jgi:hypothetical protein
VLLVLVAYRLIAPASERRLHRQWFGQIALGDLLGSSLADPHKLSRAVTIYCSSTSKPCSIIWLGAGAICSI